MDEKEYPSISPLKALLFNAVIGTLSLFFLLLAIAPIIGGIIASSFYDFKMHSDMIPIAFLYYVIVIPLLLVSSDADWYIKCRSCKKEWILLQKSTFEKNWCYRCEKQNSKRGNEHESHH